MRKPVADTPIKSPYGIVTAVLQKDTDNCIRVTTDTGEDRYFFSPNWTYFEKDTAKEIDKNEYINFIMAMCLPLHVKEYMINN